MANRTYLIGHTDHQPVGGQSFVKYIIADTDAGKPTSALNVGDLCYAVDTTTLYFANSATTWESTALVKRLRATDYVLVGNIGTQYIKIGPLGGVSISATVPYILLGYDSVGDGVIEGSTEIQTRATATSHTDYIPAISGDFVLVHSNSKNLASNAAAIGSTALVTTANVGLWRVSYYLQTNTVDATAGTLTATIGWTDSEGATSATTAAINLAIDGSKTAGDFTLYAASGNITYLTTLTGLIGSARYQLRLRAEFLA